MTETFAALLLAHALADFVFQTAGMMRDKRRLLILIGHGAVVLATAVAATGSLHPVLAALAGVHLLIDAAKIWSGLRGLWPFLADQALHLASLVAVAAWEPGLFAGGLWSPLPWLPGAMAGVAGLILTIRAGGFAVGLLMAGLPGPAPEGLPNAGRMIGALERGLIFLFVLSGQIGAVGFLIAAKSVLRFGSVGNDRAASEYVIIGTLASFGWALVASYATVELMQSLSALPALGIPAENP